jgi:LmbE family N-acetylglucosaminyl deacetylase
MDRGILAIVSHPDDETFGCGGTLALHSMERVPVNILCLTCYPAERREELVNAGKSLGLDYPIILDEVNIEVSSKNVTRVADIIVDNNPKVVITHLPFDYHREHRATYELVKEAVEWSAHTTIYDKPCKVERLLLMEVNSLIPKPHVLVDISDVIELKKAAISAYSSQLAKFDWGYYESFNLKKAELRGVQGNCKYAEAFLEEPISQDGPFYPVKTSRVLI